MGMFASADQDSYYAEFILHAGCLIYNRVAFIKIPTYVDTARFVGGFNINSINAESIGL